MPLFVAPKGCVGVLREPRLATAPAFALTIKRFHFGASASEVWDSSQSILGLQPRNNTLKDIRMDTVKGKLYLCQDNKKVSY